MWKVPRKRTNDEHMKKLIDESKILVMKQNNRIIGTICCECKDESAELTMLCLKPDAQGGGLGKKLVEAAELMAKDKGCS